MTIRPKNKNDNCAVQFFLFWFSSLNQFMLHVDNTVPAQAGDSVVYLACLWPHICVSKVQRATWANSPKLSVQRDARHGSHD